MLMIGTTREINMYTSIGAVIAPITMKTSATSGYTVGGMVFMHEILHFDHSPSKRLHTRESYRKIYLLILKRR